MPRTVRAGHERGRGRACPLILSATIRTRPAAIQRIAAMSIGGMVSSAILIARYVVPQTTHTTAQARYARPDDDMPGFYAVK
jgi:hypothetical protein